MPLSTSSSDLRPAAIIALLLAVLLTGAWEAYWRSEGSVPSYRNSDGLWAMQRRRINNGEGDKTVLAGSSRMYFNTQLDIWERESGQRPIQLALEGTSPVALMESLADDPDFTGTLIVGVAPGLFFSGYEYRAAAFKQYPFESPAHWLGQRISMLVEPYLAFYHADYSLFTVLKRQPLPLRAGVDFDPDVRRLATYTRDRGARMWSKVEQDTAYADIAKKIWARNYVPIDELSAEELEGRLENRNEQLERAIAVTEKLLARGIEVIFVRNPAEGHYAINEPMYNPRAETWDVLIEKTGALGIHWLDHAELQGYWLPEWSHMSGSEADRYSKALYHLLQRERKMRREDSEG